MLLLWKVLMMVFICIGVGLGGGFVMDGVVMMMRWLVVK